MKVVKICLSAMSFIRKIYRGGVCQVLQSKADFTKWVMRSLHINSSKKYILTSNFSFTTDILVSSSTWIFVIHISQSTENMGDDGVTCE